LSNIDTRPLQSVSIPAVPSGADLGTQNFLSRVKEQLEIYQGIRGNSISRVVTIGDLQDHEFTYENLVEATGDYGNISSNSVWGPVPQPPTSLARVTQAGDGIATPFCHTLTWTNPVDDNHWYTEVWVNTSDAISTASRIGIVPNTVNTFENWDINLNSDYYYWIRSISYGNKYSTWEPTLDVGGYLVESVGTIQETITNLINALKGESPTAWNSGTTYSVGNYCSHTSGTETRSYRCIVGHTNKEPPNTTYWERAGILMTGEVDGSELVGIDGQLVVDGSILARSIYADSAFFGGDANGAVTINNGCITVTQVDNSDAPTLSAMFNSTQEWSDVQNKPTALMQIFYQSSAPSSGMSTGDFWIDSDDNKLYRYNGSWAEVQDDGIATAITNAATAQSTADGKVTTFIQTSAPTAEGAGDLWIDSDDGYKMYRWSGSAWVDVRDTGIAQAISDAAGAQATADGKVVTFVQTSAPTAEGAGDLWLDSDDGYKLYRWSGSAWVDIQDTAITTAINNAATAQATADGKIVTFYQASAPTAEGAGDIWIDTDDDNKPYRWSGSAWQSAEYDVADWAKITGANKPDNNATNNASWEHASDTTKIDGGDIYTNSVTVSGLNSDATDRMFADSTTKSNVEGWKHGSDVTKIDGGDIYANSVTATQISVNDLAAINADLGSVTAGNITLDTSGFIKTSGKDSYNDSTAGFFIGYSGGAYQFGIGDGTNYLTWDGSALVLAGTIAGVTAGDVLEAAGDSVETSTSSTYVKLKTIYIGRAGTYRVKFDMKSSLVSTVYGRVYKDGVAHGTQRASPSLSYVTYSEDLTFSSGDECQLYVHITAASGNTVHVKNFRVYVANPIVSAADE